VIHDLSFIQTFVFYLSTDIRGIIIVVTVWQLTTFCVTHRRRKMYCGHARLCVCVSVCLSAAARTHYCMDPDVTWGRGRGCPLVVHYWADLQSGNGLRCYGNITRTQLQACIHPAIWRHSANGRLGGVCTRCWPVTGRRRRGRSRHYCGGLDCGLPRWRSGNITRTQNGSEHLMLVLALCLVLVFVKMHLSLTLYLVKVQIRFLFRHQNFRSDE